MDINCAVSSNLKLVRESKKLSLDSVSQLTGVSKSMLGQIERGEVNPTISVLWKIASGLKVSFTSLIDMQTPDIELIDNAGITPLIEDNGKYINRPIFSFDESRGFESYRIEILPEGFFEAAPHHPACEEYITLFSGCVEVTVGQDVHILNQWDSLRFKADVPYKYRNIGCEIAQLSLIIHYQK